MPVKSFYGSWPNGYRGKRRCLPFGKEKMAKARAHHYAPYDKASRRELVLAFSYSQYLLSMPFTVPALAIFSPPEPSSDCGRNVILLKCSGLALNIAGRVCSVLTDPKAPSFSRLLPILPKSTPIPYGFLLGGEKHQQIQIWYEERRQIQQIYTEK